MKIIDILRQHQANPLGKTCISFEYYPPKSRERWPEFYEKIARMGSLGPRFIDVTWGTGDPTSLDTIEIAKNIQERTGIDAMMHLTCTHRTREELLDIMAHVVEETPMRNVMALRGNRPKSGDWTPHPGGFGNACELVRALRGRFGDARSIAVAGYPEGHREDGHAPDASFVHSAEYAAQMRYMREKVDAGADFIVTQLCFDLARLCRYRDDCARVGISCPIVPGILPVHGRQTWERIAAFSASIPAELAARYEKAAHGGDEAIEAFAVELLGEQIAYLRHEGFCAVHLYTLNHERVISRALQRGIR